MLFRSILFFVIGILGFPEGIKYFFPGFMLYFTVSSATVLALVLSKSVFSFIMIFFILNGFVAELFVVFMSLFVLDERIYFVTLKNIIYFFTPFTSVRLFVSEDADRLLGMMPVIMGGIQLAAAFLLHRIRSGEGNGTLAFQNTRYPIQYLIDRKSVV